MVPKGRGFASVGVGDGERGCGRCVVTWNGNGRCAVIPPGVGWLGGGGVVTAPYLQQNLGKHDLSISLQVWEKEASRYKAQI